MISKKISKKILTVVTTFTLLCSVFVMPTSAATTKVVNSNTKGTINISVPKANEENTIKASVYQVISVKIKQIKDDTNAIAGAPQEKVYNWTSIGNDFIAAHNEYSAYADCNASFNTDDPQNANAVTQEKATEIFDKMSSYIRANDISPTYTATLTDGEASLNVDMGEYIILLEDGTNVYQASVVNVVPYAKNELWYLDDQSVVIKATKPQIDKKVNSLDVEQVAIGDELQYEITIDVPYYPDSIIEGTNKVTYTVKDTLDEGLILKKGSKVLVYGVSDKETLIDTINVTSDTKNFTWNGDGRDIGRYTQVKLRYTVTVNSTVPIATPDSNKPGMWNNATLIYSNNPYDLDSTEEMSTNVVAHTYGIDLTKVDRDGVTKLDGAHFTLKKQGSDTPLTFNMEMPRNGGVYTYDPDAQNSDLIVSSLTDNKGQLILKGLDVGTYVLEETRAPNGYNLLEKTITITITDNDKDGYIEEENKDTNSGYVYLNIKNTKSFTLPLTGDKGSMILVASGIGIICIGFIIGLRRKEQK